ncbi:Branched-chain amino acid ABC-type transport system, permease component [Rhizobium mongolense subsp. loessense]|uniref:Branched-chain amino acid ABC-type transport system, permease component n=2 Tax=Rhizobium mongolense TaxID=57676 RepID=A0A1G4P9G3_9HYPH|nr:Branched-chain amino acid ABC-type transport system, permease component [Rhizobium mongolense subsp. loessense]
MRGRGVEPVGPGIAEGYGKFAKQVREELIVIACQNPLPEITVRRLAQSDEIRPVFWRHRKNFPEKGTLGAEFRRRMRKARELFIRSKAVDAARYIMAQNDAVGDIQRQRATRKTMCGPGKVHRENITGKIGFASYYLQRIGSFLMGYLLQQLANAVPLAALYAALAFGYALAFGVTKRADITYGAVFAFAGQMLLLFTDFAYNRLWLVLPASLAIGAVMSFTYSLGAGFWIGRSVMQPLVRRSPNTVIVAALGVTILLMETARLASDTRELWLSPFLNRTVIFWSDASFKVTLTYIQLINTGLMCALIVVGGLVLRCSAWGRVWRAVTDDPLAAELCGVSAIRVFLAAYVAAVFIATCCGILTTFYYGSMDFGAGLLFGLKVLMIAAAGGYSDPLKSAGGAAGIGFAETLWTAYGPFLWRDFVIFSLLVFLLVLSRRERAIP